MRYQDKVVIITGGSRGIGAGCARAFTEAGAVVVIADIDECVGSALVAELNRRGPATTHFVACDVTREADIEHLIEETIRRAGGIDCLINNAGWHPPHKPIDDFSTQEFRDLLELNLIGMFTACRIALPYLHKAAGNIINISSLVAQIGQLHAVTYVATFESRLNYKWIAEKNHGEHGGHGEFPVILSVSSVLSVVLLIDITI